MKKHKHRRYEPDPDAPRRRSFQLSEWELWEDDWDDDLEDDDEEDEDWERSLGRIDLWAEHWSEVDSSQAGRWRRATHEGEDRRTA